MEKVEGEIGYFGLEGWWLQTFTAAEREYIERTFRPLGIGIGQGEHDQTRPLTRGRISYLSGSATGLLSGLAGWFRKDEDRHIAQRLLDKAEQLAGQASIIDRHFMYQAMIEHSLHNPVKSSGPTIDACMKQISLAPEVARAFLKEYPGQGLPGHVGFQELVSIRAKLGDYKEAIRLCGEAKQQGWAGDWKGWELELRIDELVAEAEGSLARSDVASAQATFAKIIDLDRSQVARVRRREAEHYL